MQELKVGDAFTSGSGNLRITIEAIRGRYCDYLVQNLRGGTSKLVKDSALYATSLALYGPQWSLETLSLENE
jgi:hypothetical protein